MHDYLPPHGKERVSTWRPSEQQQKPPGNPFTSQNCGQSREVSEEVAKRAVDYKPRELRPNQFAVPPPPEFKEALAKLTSSMSMNVWDRTESKIGRRTGKVIEIDASPCDENWFRENAHRLPTRFGLRKLRAE